MYLAYSLLTLAVFFVVSPYFLYQAIRYKKYIGTLRQRLGFLPITFNIDAEESIWIHAVSVGAALTARARTLSPNSTAATKLLPLVPYHFFVLE